MRGNSHVRCEVGENLEITSKDYLSLYEAGRSEDIEGDYEEKIAGEILSWPDMINN